MKASPNAPLNTPETVDKADFAEQFLEIAWSLFGIALLALAAAFYVLPSWKAALIGRNQNTDVRREMALENLFANVFLPNTLFRKWSQPDLDMAVAQPPADATSATGASTGDGTEASAEKGAFSDLASADSNAAAETSGNPADPQAGKKPTSARDIATPDSRMPSAKSYIAPDAEDYPLKPWMISDRLPLFALAACMLAAAWGAGQLMLRLLGLDHKCRGLESVALATVVGLTLASTFTVIVGLLGLLKMYLVFIAVGVIALVFGGIVALSGRGKLACEEDALAATMGKPVWLVWGVGFALTTAVVMLAGILPSVEFDVVEYHLQAPREWYEAGVIGRVPHNIYANMPMHAEMHALPAMSILGDYWVGGLVGKLMIALYAPLTSLLLFAIGRRFFSPRAAVGASLLYLAVPEVMSVSVSGMVEGVMACYFTAAVLCLARWHAVQEEETSRGRENVWVMLAGWLIGSIVATKYTAVVFFFVPFTLWMGSTVQKRGWAPLLWFLVFATLPAAPWLIKNAVFTGNPVYPLLEGKLGTAFHSPDQIQRFTTVHRPDSFQFIALEWNLTQALLLADWVNPFVLPLALIGLLGRRWRLAVGLGLAYYGYCLVEWWFLTHRLARFLDPMLPCLVLLAGVGTEAFQSRLWKTATAACIAVSLLVTIGLTSSEAFAMSSFFAPLNDLRNDARICNGWQTWLNVQQLEPGEKVMMLAEGAVFNVKHPLIYSTCFDDCPWETHTKGKSPIETWETLRKLNVKYIYVSWRELNRYRSPGNYGFSNYLHVDQLEAILQKGLVEIIPETETVPFSTAGITVFRVKDTLPLAVGKGVAAEIEIPPAPFDREHQMLAILLQGAEASRLLSISPARGEEILFLDPKDATAPAEYGTPFTWRPIEGQGLALGVWFNRVLPANESAKILMVERDLPFQAPFNDFVVVNTDVGDGGVPLFRIDTPGAKYVFDGGSGALLSMVDGSGKDWVGRDQAEGAGSSRGAPFIEPANCPMRAGSNECETTLIADTILQAVIQVQSKDGRWKMLWDVRPQVLLLQVVETPEPYSLGFTGLPGGELAPDSDRWVSGDGASGNLTAPYAKLREAQMQWIALADGERDVSLLLLQQSKEPVLDAVGMVGEGEQKSAQVVFARGGEHPRLTQSGATMALLLAPTRDGAKLELRALDLGNPPAVKFTLP